MSDDTPEAAPAAAGAPSQQPGREPRTIEVRHRRAPRFGRFIGTGIMLGVLLAVVLTLAGRSGSGWVLLPLAVGLGMVGALVGGGIAVVADRRSG